MLAVIVLCRRGIGINHKPAYVGLFEYYRDGTGTAQSCFTALEWLQKGLDKQDAEAQYEKTKTYLSEVCAQENDEEAKKWLRLSAAQKYRPAVEQLEHLRRYELAEERRERELLERQIEAANAKNNNSNNNNSNSNNKGWTYSSAKEYYKNKLAALGKIFHGGVEQGSSYSCEFTGHGDHILRVVVNEGTRPGYYPLIKITYYDSHGEKLGSYTSTSADIKRLNEHLTVLEVGVGDLPYSVRRASIQLVRGSGHLISVMD